MARRKQPRWNQPTFYRENRKAKAIAYVRAEVILTQQDWLDLEVIAADKKTTPRILLAEVAYDWLRKEIKETFEEAA